MLLQITDSHINRGDDTNNNDDTRMMIVQLELCIQAPVLGRGACMLEGKTLESRQSKMIASLCYDAVCNLVLKKRRTAKV